MQGGPSAAGIDSDQWTFANHGCNGTYNIGKKYALNELNMMMEPNPQNFYEKFYGESSKSSSALHLFYHPYEDRHFPTWSCQDAQANRNIEAGEELSFNYLEYGGANDAIWIEMIEELNMWCNGGIGFVAQYDMIKGGLE